MLLSNHNVKIARLFVKILWLLAHFSDYPVKIAYFDKVGEFTFQILMITRIIPTIYVQTQNNLIESFIMQILFPILTCGNVILYITTLICIKPTNYLLQYYNTLRWVGMAISLPKLRFWPSWAKNSLVYVGSLASSSVAYLVPIPLHPT